MKSLYLVPARRYPPRVQYVLLLYLAKLWASKDKVALPEKTRKEVKPCVIVRKCQWLYFTWHPASESIQNLLKIGSSGGRKVFIIKACQLLSGGISGCAQFGVQFVCIHEQLTFSFIAHEKNPVLPAKDCGGWHMWFLLLGLPSCFLTRGKAQAYPRFHGGLSVP